MVDLTGNSETSLGDGFLLRAPDLLGTLDELDIRQRDTRGLCGLQQPEIARAALLAGIDMWKVFEIEVRDDVAVPDVIGSRASGMVSKTRLGEDAIELEVPVTSERQRVTILYTDESGASRWIFPSDTVKVAVTRGSCSCLIFALPRDSASLPPQEVQASRGKLTKLGRRLIRVLTWVTDPLLGESARNAAKQWEDKNRPYGFRSFPFEINGSEPDWRSISEDRALLFIHGTFSSAFGGFSDIPVATASALQEHYGTRIFGFDHPSLHQSPKENAQILLDMLAQRLPQSKLTFDLVSHSRGGLVVRQLCDGLLDLNTHGLTLNFRRAVLIGSPNLGTVLADGNHGIDFLDRYTNLITDLPDNGFTLIMEGLLALAKIVYHAAVNELPGLVSMNPDGKFLDTLSSLSPSEVDYRAIGANFKPSLKLSFGGIGRWVGNTFIDTCFSEDNDLVVPTEGMFERKKGYAWIPPNECLRLGDTVHHLNYFLDDRVCNTLTRWLTT